MDKLSLYTILKSVFLCVIYLPVVSPMHLSSFAHPRSDVRPDALTADAFVPQIPDNQPIQSRHRVRHARAKRAHRRSILFTHDMDNATVIPQVSSHDQATPNMHVTDQTLTSAPSYLHSTPTEDKHQPESLITSPHETHKEHIRPVSTVTSTPDKVLSRHSMSGTSITEEQSNQTTLRTGLTMARGNVTLPITNSLPVPDFKTSLLEAEYTQPSVNDVTSQTYIDFEKDAHISHISTSSPLLQENSLQDSSHEAEQFASTVTSSVVQANVITATAMTDERPLINADSGDAPATSSPLTTAGDENQLITSRHNTHRSQLTSSYPLLATANVNSLNENASQGAQIPASTAAPADLDISESNLEGQVVDTTAMEAATKPTVFDSDVDKSETIETSLDMNFTLSRVITESGVKPDPTESQIITTDLVGTPGVVTSPPDAIRQVTQRYNDTESKTTQQSEDSMFDGGRREKSLTHTTEMGSFDPHRDREIIQTTPRVSDSISTDSVHVFVVMNNTIRPALPNLSTELLPGNETDYLSENVTESPVAKNDADKLTTVRDSNTTVASDTNIPDQTTHNQGIESAVQRMTTESAIETTAGEPVLTTETAIIDVTSEQSDLSIERDHSASKNTTKMPSLMDTTQPVIITSDTIEDKVSSPNIQETQEILTTALPAHVTESVTEQTQSLSNSSILETIENTKNRTHWSPSTTPPAGAVFTPSDRAREVAAYWDKLWLFILISCCVLAATLLIFLLALVIFFATRRKTPKKRPQHYFYPRKNHPFTDSDLMYSTEVGTSETEEMTFGTFGKTRGRDRVMLSGSNEKIMHPFIAPGVDFIRIKSNPLRTNGTKAEYV